MSTLDTSAGGISSRDVFLFQTITKLHTKGNILPFIHHLHLLLLLIIITNITLQPNTELCSVQSLLWTELFSAGGADLMND